MTDSRYSRAEVRSCKTCTHYEAPPSSPPFASNCKSKLVSWYPERGYAPCLYYIPKPLTDEDYE